MNNKKNIIITKIDLLIISLETINMFFNKNINHIDKNYYNLKNNKFDHNKFTNIFKYIYDIRLIIKTYNVDKIAIDILKQYTLLHRFHIINKYNKRFYNIYYIKKEYYKNHKLLYNTSYHNMNDISIINLYIISQLRKKRGIYLLIKYLIQ